MKNNNRALGIGLIVAALTLMYFSMASTGGGFTGVFEKNDKKVSCEGSFDYDSVLSASCSVVSTCNAGLPFFLGIGEQKTVVRMISNGVTYGSQKYTTTFGFNENYEFSGCVPGSATKVTVQVVGEDGQVKDQKEASLQ